MMHHRYIVFLSLILILLFKQAVSKHELEATQLVTDSGLVDQESNTEGETPLKEKKMKKGAFSSINSLLHLSLVIENNPTIPPEMEEGCKKADYPRACEVAAISNVKEGNKIDALTIYYSSTEALQQALETAKASLEQQRMSGVDEKVSGVCVQVYGDALTALNKALKASVERDRYMVFLHFSAVNTNIETCQETAPYKSKSKLEQVNMVLWRLSANSLSLAAEAIN